MDLVKIKSLFKKDPYTEYLKLFPSVKKAFNKVEEGLKSGNFPSERAMKRLENLKLKLFTLSSDAQTIFKAHAFVARHNDDNEAFNEVKEKSDKIMNMNLEIFRIEGYIQRAMKEKK